ncbi:zinc finger, CCHC-type containing protein [Tanacetum coccineum]
MSLDEAIGRLNTFEERLKYKNERPVNTQERLLFTRHEDQGQQFRRHGDGRFNQSRGQENNFKKESNSNSNKFTHDKSKVLCFKCKEYGHFANKCPSKKEEQSNLIEEDLELTLLMATVEEAPGRRQSVGGITNQKAMINLDLRKITAVKVEVIERKKMIYLDVRMITSTTRNQSSSSSNGGFNQKMDQEDLKIYDKAIVIKGENIRPNPIIRLIPICWKFKSSYKS